MHSIIILNYAMHYEQVYLCSMSKSTVFILANLIGPMVVVSRTTPWVDDFAFVSLFQSSILASGLGDDYIVTSRTYDVTGMRHHHSYSTPPPSLPVRVDTSFRIQLLRLGMEPCDLRP
jgi:hypothetical protein